MYCAHWMDSHCSVVHSTKKARVDSQFLTENHLVWGTLTDTGTDFCVSTWLRTVTACLNVVAKRDGAALPRLPSFSPVWCQLACLSISRVKYKKANHINVTSKYLQVPAKKCPHFYSNSFASRIGKKRHNEGARVLFFYFIQEDKFVPHAYLIVFVFKITSSKHSNFKYKYSLLVLV